MGPEGQSLTALVSGNHCSLKRVEPVDYWKGKTWRSQMERCLTGAGWDLEIRGEGGWGLKVRKGGP